jgi:hypothetical protein
MTKGMEDKYNTGGTIYLDKDGKPIDKPDEPEKPSAEEKDKKGGK